MQVIQAILLLIQVIILLTLAPLITIQAMKLLIPTLFIILIQVLLMIQVAQNKQVSTTMLLMLLYCKITHQNCNY